MALAAPASLLWKPATASGPCRDGCNDGRHDGARAEFSGGAAVAGRDREAQQWERCRQSCASPARVSCFMGGNKRDAAKKALESALGEKKDAFSKLDEEIKKRQESGGGGGGRGRGWGSGGGGGGGGAGGGGGSSGGGLPRIPSNSMDEAKQMVLAFLGLTALYLVLTQGKSMLAVSVNSALYVLRGFKKSGSSSSTRREPALSRPIGDGPGPAESSVMSKWGRD
ncbi:hypothetical protein KC19_2G183200 [Ceratodon purpureus]|uniref:Uncharacterized protein n=1 Tax=Ceratodon purpureus TaxID=3225 RepID=A0A8T0IX53_CERPU|nr:hypothetical protein KC19_2G183200 [Ceratodon purpureus]